MRSHAPGGYDNVYRECNVLSGDMLSRPQASASAYVLADPFHLIPSSFVEVGWSCPESLHRKCHCCQQSISGPDDGKTLGSEADGLHQIQVSIYCWRTGLWSAGMLMWGADVLEDCDLCKLIGRSPVRQDAAHPSSLGFSVATRQSFSSARYGRGDAPLFLHDGRAFWRVDVAGPRKRVAKLALGFEWLTFSIMFIWRRRGGKKQRTELGSFGCCRHSPCSMWRIDIKHRDGTVENDREQCMS